MWLGAILVIVLLALFDGDGDSGCSGQGCLLTFGLAVMLGAFWDWLMHWDPGWAELARLSRMVLAVVFFLVLAKVLRSWLEGRFYTRVGKRAVQSHKCRNCARKLALALTIFMSVSLYCYQKQSFAEQLEADIGRAREIMQADILEEEKLGQTERLLKVYDSECTDRFTEYTDVVKNHPDGTVLWCYAKVLHKKPRAGVDTVVQKGEAQIRLYEEESHISQLLRQWGQVDQLLKRIPDNYQGEFLAGIQVLRQQSASEQQRLQVRKDEVTAEQKQLEEQEIQGKLAAKH